MARITRIFDILSLFVYKRDARAGQLANSIAWFKEYYEKEEQCPILIHPGKELAPDTYLADPFWVMQPEDLKKLQGNTKKFYSSITGIPFDSLRPETITKKLKDHNIDSDGLVKTYLHRGERASKS